MTECCQHRDMNIPKKSQILKILQNGPKLKEVRILAAGLLQVMLAVPEGGHPRLRPFYEESDSAYSSSEGGEKGDAYGSRRSVLGKHVLVTLGDQGVLWVSSSGAAMGWDGKAQSAAMKDIIELDDNTFSR